MKEEIYNPLAQYREKYREKFLEVAARTFEELAAASGVDAADNKKTCDEIRSKRAMLDKVKSRQTLWRLLCGLLYAAAVAGGFLVWKIVDTDFTLFDMDRQSHQYVLAGTAAGVVIILILQFTKIHPLLKVIGDERASLEQLIDELLKKAWEQMAPLNRLYDWDIFARMMSETVPMLEFDPFFTTQRLEDLKRVYGWDDTFNEGRSVLYSHSGLINGNPFVLCRTKKMVMGQKTYYGHKTIHWTSRHRNSQGKMETVHHSQVLTATYTAPYPEYYQKTRLFYGNIAAPDLCFDRTKNTLSGEEGSLSYKWKLSRLKKQARKEDSNFVLMQNEQFEVLFNTRNRNHEQQFRLLFTPLAQESMLDLLRDKQDGYGDDFDFTKRKMINVIVSDHIQGIEFDMDPARYRHYDYEYAQQNFVQLNAQYFRAMYFCLAPLLCVPMYQQIRTPENIYGYGSRPKSAFWEHEALANFWGEEKFKHPRCATESILKTSERQLREGSSAISVEAHGYEAVRHIHYGKVLGGDGKVHSVPVEWYEYRPVVGNGTILMDEDIQDDARLTPQQRQTHISQRLASIGGRGIYRRHIASHL